MGELQEHMQHIEHIEHIEEHVEVPQPEVEPSLYVGAVQHVEPQHVESHPMPEKEERDGGLERDANAERNLEPAGGVEEHVADANAETNEENPEVKRVARKRGKRRSGRKKN